MGRACQDQIKSFGGGAFLDLEHRCLGRMKAWVKVAETVVAAEFPYFDCLLAFEVLNLSKQPKGHRSADAQKAESEERDAANIARLALLLHLDREELFTQWIDHRPIARRILVSESTTNFEAWKAAVLRTQRSSHGRVRHPAVTLTKLLVAYGCYGASSSGVEQGFSKTQKNVSKTLMDTAEVSEMTSRAAVMWKLHYGEVRSSPKHPRIDKGLKRVPAAGSNSKRKQETEIAFLRRRRRAVASASASSSTRHLAVEDTDSDVEYFGEGHEKERKFNEQKLLRKKVEASNMGTLFEHEQSPEFLEQAARIKAKQSKVDKERLRAEKNIRLRMLGGALIPKTDMKGWTAYVDKAVYDKHRQKLDEEFRQHGIVLTDSRGKAKV
jgi:hypothetical protein